MTEYMQTVFKPKWDKWQGQVTNLEKKLEEQVFKSLEKEKAKPAEKKEPPKQDARNMTVTAKKKKLGTS